MCKKMFIVAILCVFSIVTFAQKDVTKFLGIPVDGTKSEMLSKIKAEGFTESSTEDGVLEGEFNGVEVYINVLCNRNKVRRVAVMTKNSYDEINAKIRYNKLCEQFINNGNYVTLSELESMMIPEKEDIDYEISVNNKRYEASFYQKSDLDSLTASKNIEQLIIQKYTQEQLENPTEEILEDVINMSVEYAFGLVENKSVWFMLDREYGRYKILLFYDNKYNEAHGEDL